MFYEIYDIKANQYILMGEATLREMYSRNGNHKEYPTFEGWVRELSKLGIAREV